MGRKPSIKVTAKVQQRTRIQQRVRVQHRVQHTTRALGWYGEGEPSPAEINYYGDSYAISGESHQVAIGVSGGVTQIGGAGGPVDVDRLHAAMQQLIDLLEGGHLEVDDPDDLRAQAEDVLDEAAEAEPDHARLRAGARGVVGRVATAAAGGTVAQLMGQAITAAL